MSILKKITRRPRRLASKIYFGAVEAAMAKSRARPSSFSLVQLSSQAEFLTHLDQTQAERARRAAVERALLPSRWNFRTSGYCFACSRWTHFRSSWTTYPDKAGVPQKVIWWREQLSCPRCRLNNRMRASLHLLAESGVSLQNLRVYATEQATPMFAELKNHCQSLVGSEFLGETVPRGASNAAGVMNQDLTRLTFPDNHFDLILSFDVLEHVPDYSQAFKECARTLKEGGKMLFSAPFNAEAASTLVRCRIRDDGTIEHLEPPEYHGDPLSSDGCLCFYHFGWEILEQLKQAGFSKSTALLYHSREFGCFGENQIQFLVEK